MTSPSDQLALGGQRIDVIEIQIGKRANSGNSVPFLQKGNRGDVETWQLKLLQAHMF